MLIFRVKIESTFFRKRHFCYRLKVVKVVMVILVIFIFEVCLLLTIIIKIYFYYYSGVFCLSKIDFDQMTK